VCTCCRWKAEAERHEEICRVRTIRAQATEVQLRAELEDVRRAEVADLEEQIRLLQVIQCLHCVCLYIRLLEVIQCLHCVSLYCMSGVC
jgi:hypothetical protein